MKFSRHRIKLGKCLSSLPVHASHCTDSLGELEQAAAVAWVSPAPALSPIRVSIKSLARPMFPTEPVPRLANVFFIAIAPPPSWN
jgi:hypothetical protein